MSNHFSADNLKFPGDDRRLDLTDLFVFKSAGNPGTTVLIMDSNPTSAPPPIPAPVTGPEFYPGAVYRINIDTDGDNLADVAFTFVFSEYRDGRQTGTAWYAPGPEARQPGTSAHTASPSPPRHNRADHGLEPDQCPAADPGPGDRPGVLPRRGLPDQHRHRR